MSNTPRRCARLLLLALVATFGACCFHGHHHCGPSFRPFPRHCR